MQDEVEEQEPGKSASIHATVLPAEKAAIKRLARAEAMTPSSYVRRLILRDLASRDAGS